MGRLGDRVDDGDRRRRHPGWDVGALPGLILLLSVLLLSVLLASCGPTLQPGQRPNQFPLNPSAAGEELVRSAKNENWQRFAELRDSGVPIDSVNKMGQTSLQVVAAKGDMARVRRWTRVGADTGGVLHAAAGAGQLEVVDYFLPGADPNELDALGATPLFDAAWRGHLAIVKLLVEHGADVNVQDSVGRTALRYSIWDSWQIPEADRLAVAEYLIQQGADVDQAAADGYTPLHEAASRGYQSIVEVLIEQGADVNAHAVGADGQVVTPLDVVNRAVAADARLSGTGGILPLLIEQGAKPGSQWSTPAGSVPGK